MTRIDDATPLHTRWIDQTIIKDEVRISVPLTLTWRAFLIIRQLINLLVAGRDTVSEHEDRYYLSLSDVF